MVRRSRFIWVIGLVSIGLLPAIAGAAIWSVESDCEEGSWSVEVRLPGFGSVDASCADGEKSQLLVDVGDTGMADASISATSATGTMCDTAAGGDDKLKLECGAKIEDPDGFEREEEIEVEVERLQEDEPEEIELDLD